MDKSSHTLPINATRVTSAANNNQSSFVARLDGNDENMTSDDLPIIIGGAIGGVACLAAVIATIFCFTRSSKSETKKEAKIQTKDDSSFRTVASGSEYGQIELVKRTEYGVGDLEGF